MRGRLDSTDLAILKELQADGSITNVELARRVGLSAPPCLRRVRSLEDAGVIKSYRALVDPAALGFEVVCFAMVQLAAQGQAELAAFQARVREWPTVRECWTLSGDIDFILKCVAPNLAAFQAFVVELTALPNVRNVRTALTLDLVKDEPLVPIA
ncbi:MAG TPA: Lrp/AsnC family transcriptional regulator [Beijerinckiaceae bacterium]